MRAGTSSRIYLTLVLVLGLAQAREGQAGTEPPAQPAGTPAAAVAPTPPASIAAPEGGKDAVVLPELQPGMWEYHRTLVSGQRGRPQVASVRKCSNPREDYDRKMQELRQKGCQFSPLLQTGNRFEAAWRCPVEGGSVMLRDVVTVRSSTSYTDETETRTRDQLTHTVITANRRGDCTPSQGTIQSPSATTRVPSRPLKRTM